MCVHQFCVPENVTAMPTVRLKYARNWPKNQGCCYEGVKLVPVWTVEIHRFRAYVCSPFFVSGNVTAMSIVCLDLAK